MTEQNEGPPQCIVHLPEYNCAITFLPFIYQIYSEMWYGAISIGHELRRLEARSVRFFECANHFEVGQKRVYKEEQGMDTINIF